MKVALEKPGTPQELAHHGVKGMRWGVRKAYTDRQQKIADREKRVVEGTGSTAEKLRVHGKTSNYEIARYGGFKEAAGARATNRQAHIDRLNKGEAKVKDHLKMFGNLTFSDVAKGTAKGLTTKK